MGHSPASARVCCAPVAGSTQEVQQSSDGVMTKAGCAKETRTMRVRIRSSDVRTYALMVISLMKILELPADRNQ